MTNNKNNADKKRLRVYYGMLITVLCIIGVSFAWFRLYLSQSENNIIASRTCFSTTLTEDSEKIALTEAFPLTDTDGLKGTPFTFTIKNNCTSYVKAYITIDSEYRTSTSSSYLSDNYIKVNLSPKSTTENKSLILGKQSLIDLDSNSKGYVILEASLGANEEKSYDLRIWMDAAVTTDQGLNKNWAGKIVVVTSAKNPSLADTVLADNEVKTTLTTPGREVSAHIYSDIVYYENVNVSSYSSYYVTYGTGYEATGAKFNLTGVAVTSNTYANSYSSLIGKYIVSNSFTTAGSTTASTIKSTTNLSTIYYVEYATSSIIQLKKITSNKNTTEALLSSTKDDYGTSYYFRGSVKNNYVEFANKCWRIVRILGNGSVKLVLHNDNVDNVEEPCLPINGNKGAAFARYSGSTYDSSFNLKSGDNAYLGFMYGTLGANDYASAHANINKSTILTNLELWYEKNLASYENELADVIWCNDKSTFSEFASGSAFADSLGYGTNKTGYGAYNRINAGNAASFANPSLICPNDNNGGKLSKFTVDDTTNGNGSLTYKIGLLTADEVAFAGASAVNYNGATYLISNTGDNLWYTMSPYMFYSDAYAWLFSSGRLTYSAYPVNVAWGLRPAIALSSDVSVSGGTGTYKDPYIVK